MFEVVEGDGHDFDFGVDYTECGVVKYLAREGAPDLAPYLCWTDYPLFAAARLRLDRTETLAQGGQTLRLPDASRASPCRSSPSSCTL